MIDRRKHNAIGRGQDFECVLLMIMITENEEKQQLNRLLHMNKCEKQWKKNARWLFNWKKHTSEQSTLKANWTASNGARKDKKKQGVRFHSPFGHGNLQTAHRCQCINFHEEAPLGWEGKQRAESLYTLSIYAIQRISYISYNNERAPSYKYWRVSLWLQFQRVFSLTAALSEWIFDCIKSRLNWLIHFEFKSKLWI